MADVYTRIGYIKGATGATGATGAKGDTGDAATIQVGSVTTVPYGQTANVVNSGTEQAAIFDFTIPQGRPGQQTTEMDDLTLNSITTSSASFPIPAIGETGKVLWGKVVKWFSDMSALVATKLNTANVVNNLTTTSSGYALDARQGKALYDSINTVSTGTTTNVTSLGNVDTGSVWKRGNLVAIYCRTWTTSSAGVQLSTQTTIFTVPVGYRPQNTVLMMASVNTTLGDDAAVLAAITSAGEVKIQSTRNYKYIAIAGTYMI